MQSKPSLPALAKAGSGVAQFYFNSRRAAHFTALGVALLMLFVPNPFVYGLAIIAVITEILAWWFRYRGEHYQRLSRELTRRALLFDAFGKLSESFELADLLHSFSEKLEQKAAQLDKEFYGEGKEYYTSDKSKGVDRLIESLQESAFWSKHLYHIAAIRTFWLLILLSFAVIFVVFFIVPVAYKGAIFVAPQIIVVFLAFVISDELSSAFAWWTAANRSEAVDRRLDKIMDLKAPSREILLAVFGDYSVATAAVPPIPSHLYESERLRLNKLWADRNASRQTTESEE